MGFMDKLKSSQKRGLDEFQPAVMKEQKVIQGSNNSIFDLTEEARLAQLQAQKELEAKAMAQAEAQQKSEMPNPMSMNQNNPQGQFGGFNMGGQQQQQALNQQPNPLQNQQENTQGAGFGNNQGFNPLNQFGGNQQQMGQQQPQPMGQQPMGQQPNNFNIPSDNSGPMITKQSRPNQPGNFQQPPSFSLDKEQENPMMQGQGQPQPIGGPSFMKDPNKPNPLAKTNKNMGNNLDKQGPIPVTPSFKVSNNGERKVDPEYYGPLRPFFENPNISSIHMYGHELISYQISGEDVIGQPIWNSEMELVEFLEGLINWNDKDPHYVNLKNFREEKRTFGTFYMKDLSRLHIAITEDEIYATIAVKKQDSLSLDDLCSKYGMFDEKIKNFIYEAIQANAKIILAGQGGAGKTTFIQACANLINPKNVTLVAEEYRELKLNRPNVKYVNANDNRPLHKVVAESTKMRIRNLIVGEVIGEEALAMLEAMNTGLDVVLATTHANGAYHALNRLITLACRNPNVNPKFVKGLIGDNVDLIIFLEEHQGKKILSEIIAIERYQEEVDKIIANHLYNFKKGQTTLQRSQNSKIVRKIEEYKKSKMNQLRGSR